MNYSVVIPSAGIGKRMGLGFNKMLYELEGKSILLRTIEIFVEDIRCNEIVLVINKDDEEVIHEILSEKNNLDNKIKLAYGGKERMHSVYNGLLQTTNEIAFVHDGARPFLTHSSIDALLEKVIETNAVILAVPSKDTIKIVKDGIIVDTPNRDYVYNAQTPQVFKRDLITECYKKAIEDDFLATDDASVCEKYSDTKVHIVVGDYNNIKITSIEDINIAKQIINERK